MNTPDTTQIGMLLSEIRDFYGTLRAMTRRFLDEFSIPALQDLLKERAVVLLKINSEEEQLIGISEIQGLKKYSQYGEISNHISAILSCDSEIAARIKYGMSEIRGRLSKLSDSSNAALKYTRHCRR